MAFNFDWLGKVLKNKRLPKSNDQTSQLPSEATSNSEFKQVFLSHCVSSMGSRAATLNKKVRERGFSTFSCVDMGGGDNFRERIVGNAINCKVMVLFVDKSWAESKECISEFNCAYENFTATGSPHFIPVFIGGFAWIDRQKHTHAV